MKKYSTSNWRIYHMKCVFCHTKISPISSEWAYITGNIFHKSNFWPVLMSLLMMLNSKKKKSIHTLYAIYYEWIIKQQIQVHSEKSPARPMLFYSINYWQQFWVQFVVQFDSHGMYCKSIIHYMMWNMTVKLPCIRPYFSHTVLCY